MPVPRPPSAISVSDLAHQIFFISDKAAVRSDAAAELDRLTRYHYPILYPQQISSSDW